MAKVLSTADFETMVGDVVTAQDPAYDEARKVWNGDIDRRPAAIARCSSTGDVVAALRAGFASGLPIAIRGGGHSFPGHSICAMQSSAVHLLTCRHELPGPGTDASVQDQSDATHHRIIAVVPLMLVT